MMELWGVYKRYGETEALRDISLKIRKGEVITVLGPNGSGKSTLLRIIAALEQPTGGKVLFKGKKFDFDEIGGWRKRATLVFQRPVVLRGSVFDNIAYGLRQRGLPRDEVEVRVSEALYTLGLHVLAKRKAKSLSGGEKQRVAIARVILKNPRILILDEATSSLDSRSEALIQDALRPLFKGRTSLVIAHRLSTVLAADIILVMDAGRIVEHGTHTELVALDGLYADLYNTQFQNQTPPTTPI